MALPFPLLRIYTIKRYSRKIIPLCAGGGKLNPKNANGDEESQGRSGLINYRVFLLAFVLARSVSVFGGGVVAG